MVEDLELTIDGVVHKAIFFTEGDMVYAVIDDEFYVQKLYGREARIDVRERIRTRWPKKSS